MSISCNFELGTVLYRILIYIDIYRPEGGILKNLVRFAHLWNDGILGLSNVKSG